MPYTTKVNKKFLIDKHEEKIFTKVFIFSKKIMPESIEKNVVMMLMLDKICNFAA